MRSAVHRRSVSAGHERVRADLEDPRSLARAVDGVDAVVHLAGVTHARDPATYDRVNADGTRNLVTAAGNLSVGRFVFVSSRAIGSTGGAYSRSKAQAEEVVNSSALEYVIVRLPEVYGTGGGEGVDRIISLAQRGSRIPVVGAGDDVLCPAHVDDIISACVRALEVPQAVGRTYTLAGTCLTVREFVNLAAEVVGRQPRILSVPVPVVSALATVSRYLPIPVYPDQLARLRSPKPPLSPEARADLSFNSRPLRDGLAEAAGRAA